MNRYDLKWLISADCPDANEKINRPQELQRALSTTEHAARKVLIFNSREIQRNFTIDLRFTVSKSIASEPLTPLDRMLFYRHVTQRPKSYILKDYTWKNHH
jgi:hypothetical protein